MSQNNHSKPDLAPHHKLKNNSQLPKSNSRIFVTAIFITAVLFMLLLIPTYTQASALTVTGLRGYHE